MGAACNVWGPKESSFHHGHDMQPYQRWTERFGSHMHHLETLWEPSMPFGGHVHHLGARWCHMGSKWCHVGAACTVGGQMGAIHAVWEQCASYGSQREPHGRWMAPCMCCHMGAAYTIREPCVCIDHGWHHMEPQALHGPSVSGVHAMGAMCTASAPCGTI
jgi:hypothetical protein